MNKILDFFRVWKFFAKRVFPKYTYVMINFSFVFIYVSPLSNYKDPKICKIFIFEISLGIFYACITSLKEFE